MYQEIRRQGALSEDVRLAFFSDRILQITHPNRIHDLDQPGREEILVRSEEWLDDSIKAMEAINRRSFPASWGEKYHRCRVTITVLKECSRKKGRLDEPVRGDPQEAVPGLMKSLLATNQKLRQGEEVSEEALGDFRDFWLTMRDQALHRDLSRCSSHVLRLAS